MKFSGRGTVGHDQVPAFLRGALYVMLVAAGVLSLPRIGEFGPLPMVSLFDAWMFLFLLATMIRGRFSSPVLLILLVMYASTRMLFVAASDSPILDFLQAYRWVFYLFVFVIAIGRKWGPIRPLLIVTWLLIGMALIKALLTFIVLGRGERPGLLTENNFELALFSGLVVVIYPHIQRRFILLMMLGALTLLSGSRSGAVAFVLLSIFAISQTRSTKLFVKYVLACLVPLLTLIPIWVFASRSAANGTIDRINFLDVFLFETRNWTLFEWIFGTNPITPLSNEGCSHLSYYETLFSSTGDGSCYSVILHAFALRVIFDAGIVGFVMVIAVAWYALNRSGVGVLASATLIVVATTNGLSVSGFNNPYVALPILMAIVTVSRRSRTESPSQSHERLDENRI